MDPENQVIETAIIEIQAPADGLDSTDTTKLTYDPKAEKDAIHSGATSDPSHEWARAATER